MTPLPALRPTSNGRPSLGIGLLGLGTAGAAMLAAILADDAFELVAIGDQRANDLPLEELAPSCLAHESLEAMLADRRVEVVYVATPTPLHVEQVAMALEAGRHVIVEKPVTTDSASGAELLALAERTDRVVVVGHSESFEPYVRTVAALVARGVIGNVGSLVAEKTTDWLCRPRAPEELDESLGGGLVRRQGVHQVDVVRTLLGGAALEVRQAHLRKDEDGAVASYLAWLESSEGTSVVLLHDASGGLSGREDRSRGGGTSSGAVQAKRARSDDLVRAALAGTPLGLGPHDRERILLLGSAGEIVASTREVRLIDQAGSRAVEVPLAPSGRAAVLRELLACLDGAPLTHGLRWGVENVRVCEEIERNAQRGGAEALALG